jgi:spore maturation protein CgeB
MEPGREVLAYRNGHEIPELIKRVLQDEKLHRIISEEGYRRVLSDHTYSRRLEKLISVMRQKYAD